MSFEPPDDLTWHKWMNGNCPSLIQVGLLSNDCMRRLGAKRATVLVARPYLQKIRFKHHLGPEEAKFITEAIERGAIISTKNKPLSFQFHVKTMATDRRYKLVLKLTEDRRQVWVSSFFRSDDRTFRVAQKQGILIRDWS